MALSAHRVEALYAPALVTRAAIAVRLLFTGEDEFGSSSRLNAKGYQVHSESGFQIWPGFDDRESLHCDAFDRRTEVLSDGLYSIVTRASSL